MTRQELEDWQQERGWPTLDEIARLRRTNADLLAALEKAATALEAHSKMHSYGLTERDGYAAAVVRQERAKAARNAIKRAKEGSP